MILVDVRPDELILSPDLARSGRSRGFEERLRSSIEEIGLAEPLKIAPHPGGGYLVIDGALRLRAVLELQKKDPGRFRTIHAYVFDFSRRYEIRYQSDIYQDLLPSQLATLVEHLHKTEGVRKAEIARYIGVSPATLRNYTGLWRLLERGGRFSRVVELMDVGVLPASNPYAWLRLTEVGLDRVLMQHFTRGRNLDEWFDCAVDAARMGTAQRYPLRFVEAATSQLPPDSYRRDSDVRTTKRELGLRRVKGTAAPGDFAAARARLAAISERSKQPVLAEAARSLEAYLP